MFDCVLFDMEGTLIDSYPGILHSYQFAFHRLGLPFPGEAFVKTAIGAPLLSAFKREAGLEQPQAVRAVAYYREYYAVRGKREAKVYEGIPQALGDLKDAGCRIATATLKRERFAAEILEENGLMPFFDLVCGMDEGDRLSKSDLIRLCLRQLNVKKARAVLVGDSEYDEEGAREAGIPFLAVTYGFGFRAGVSPPYPAARSPQEIPDQLARIFRHT